MVFFDVLVTVPLHIPRAAAGRSPDHSYDGGVNDIGKVLLVVGLVLAGIGALVMLGGGRVPLGRLPGDIVWRKGGTSVYFPIVTCIIVSAVLTLILWLVRR